jgi:hypothetical protein
MFGPRSKFGFKNPFQIFNLLPLFVKVVVVSIYAATSKSS